jgi:hypothetical protein
MVKLPIGLVILPPEVELTGIFFAWRSTWGGGKGGCFIPHTAGLGENLALHLSLRVFTILLPQIWPSFASILQSRNHILTNGLLFEDP